ncbi:MAG: radical SAM family heme chaperone HemW [Candidatus Margulisiibacteriota bacterium]
MNLYIHLPFCKKKCNYCDFVSYPDKEHLIDEYVSALVKEIKLATGDWRLETIYFGGGTPTLLEPKHFEKILNNVPRPSSLVEITIESNPGTADKTKLKELRKLGINRLSIGAQSFNDQHLKILGRIHNSKDIFRFYDDARSVGFDNINLDLIFALPNQSLEEWKSDLQTAISLKPNHLSTYALQVEEGTLFHKIIKKQDTRNKQITNSNLQLPNEDEELAMYEYTIDTLISNDYKHYEISNFAKPGHECQHNITYWKNRNYIGIGAGAHSHVDGKRWANPDSVEEYLASSPVPRPSSPADFHAERIFMGLRLLDGISAKHFQGFENELAELIESGLLTRENSHVKLTRRGLYLANEVFEKFV